MRNCVSEPWRDARRFATAFVCGFSAFMLIVATAALALGMPSLLDRVWLLAIFAALFGFAAAVVGVVAPDVDAAQRLRFAAVSGGDCGGCRCRCRCC